MSEKAVKEFDRLIAKEDNPDKEKTAEIAYEVLEDLVSFTDKLSKNMSKSFDKEFDNLIPYDIFKGANVTVESQMQTDEVEDREALIKEAKGATFGMTVTLTFGVPYFPQDEIKKSIEKFLKNSIELP